MIQKKYLQKDKILSMKNELKFKSPISYLVWEDFIDPEIYAQIEQEIRLKDYQKVDIHQDEWHRHNKTVLLEWQLLHSLFQFFESSSLEKYLSLFVWRPIKKEFYIDESMICKAYWDEKFIWAVAQVYELWDFFDWHIDGPIEHWALWAFTYYLWWYQGDWDQANGWNLQLWKKDGNWEISVYHELPYKKNTLVLIVASDNAYHRVSRLKRNVTRLSIQSTIMKQ